MSVPVRLGAFAAAAAAALGLGLGIGRAVGPLDDDPGGGPDRTHEPVRGGFGNHDHP